ncbi:MAG: hypothetical protein LBG21_06315 [Campylobacteraceae bacterium]|jgi:hypothetical protein|nr:hypothetical protein [Campylobacteraceae bacterium]
MALIYEKADGTEVDIALSSAENVKKSVNVDINNASATVEFGDIEFTLMNESISKTLLIKNKTDYAYLEPAYSYLQGYVIDNSTTVTPVIQHIGNFDANETKTFTLFEGVRNSISANLIASVMDKIYEIKCICSKGTIGSYAFLRAEEL